MYPRNAATPEPIAIGPVVQISDGAVQTTGVTVRIKPNGVAEADGANSPAYSTDGIVIYTPTQAETNYTSFILIAKKTGCFPVSQTVVTTASATPGKVVLSGETHTGAVIPSVTNVGTCTTNSDMRGTDGANTTAPDNASIMAILDDTNELQTNQDNWTTATGFSTHSAVDAAAAVWGAGSRTLTGFGTLASDVATAVWAAGSRTLTGFGTLIADILTAMFVDGGTNKIKVNADNTVEANASVTLSDQDKTDIANAVVAEIDIPSSAEIAEDLRGGRLNIGSVFEPGDDLTVFTGDSHLEANGTRISFTLTNRPELIGLIPVLVCYSGSSISAEADAVASASQSVYFELTSSQTGSLTHGSGMNPAYGVYQLRFADGSGNLVTKTNGLLKVFEGKV